MDNVNNKMSSEEYNLFFQEYIANVKSYRNKRLCTQNIFLKFF
jgi:hypothetical protein